MRQQEHLWKSVSGRMKNRCKPPEEGACLAILTESYNQLGWSRVSKEKIVKRWGGREIMYRLTGYGKDFIGRFQAVV